MTEIHPTSPGARPPWQRWRQRAAAALCAIAAIAATGFSTAHAASMLSPYGSTLGTVTNCDDCNESVSLTDVFSNGINFGGTTYTTMSVGSNGYVTFGHANSSFNPTGIAGYTLGPIVAAQYDDLDPSKGGTIYYNQNAGDGYVVVTFDAVRPFSAPAVGSASSGNTMQIVLRRIGAAGSTDFQIEIRYGTLQWASSGNVGGVFPTSGWSAGNTTSYGETSLSGASNWANSVSTTNIATAGVWRWDVTGGIVQAQPTVNQTTAATGVTGTTANTGGNVSSDGGVGVTARGVAYSTSPSPTTANSTQTTTPGTGSFSVTLTGLSTGTLYYARAYATNSIGTGYGPQIQFTTPSTTPPSAPTAASGVAGNQSVEVSWTTPSSDGGAPITGYTVTGSPSGTCTATAPATSCVVSGLSNDLGYTFTVVATNSVGNSPASTPTAQYFPQRDASTTAITGTTASLNSGTRARTNEAFTVNFTVGSTDATGITEGGPVLVEAQTALGAVIGSCSGAAVAGSGSCVLEGLKPSDNVARLVASFAQTPRLLTSQSSPFAFDVTRSNTTSTLTSNSPSVFGQDIVLSASFNATAPGANPVTGTARFIRQPGNVTITEVAIVPGVGGAPSTATTTITTDPVVAGSPYTYNVAILDNTDFIGSNNNTVHTVNRASTAVTIDSIAPAVGPDIEVNETVTVTASVAAVLPGEGTPIGTIQVRGTGGDAAATTGCDITLSGGTGSCDLSFSTKDGATLVFSYQQSANFAASSASQAVTVLGLPVTLTLTPQAGTIYYGNSYDVAYSLSGGAGNFEGAVTLNAVGATAASATCTSTSAPLNDAGVCTFAGGQDVGAYDFDGNYAGDSQDLAAIASAAASIQQATTEITIVTSPTSSAAGENVTLAVELTRTNGTGALDGSIEITANGLTNAGTPSSGCTIPVTAEASPFTGDCTRAFTLFGDDQVVSAQFYPSSANFAGDTATTLHDVTTALTTTEILGFAPVNPQVGDAVTVNFDVNGGEGTFEGLINVSVDGNAVACDPLTFDTTSGIGSCRVEALFQTAADYSFVVAFDGTDGGNDGDSTSDASVVTVAPRSTTLTVSAAPADEQQAGQTVAFTLNTAAVTDAFLDGFTAGNVAGGTAYVCLSSASPCDALSALCTATLAGAGTDGAATGTCSTSFATVGAYSFVARYVGNDDFAGSNSTVLNYDVQPRDTSIAITRVSSFTSGAAPAATALVGEQVTVSFDVDGGFGEYEGSVTVYADGPGAFAATCSGGGFDLETGVGSCTFSVGGGNGLEQAGAWTFSADFIPALEGNDAASSTGLAAAGISIQQASTTLVLSSDPAPSVFGQPFTLIATVTATAPAEGYPTGDVNFFDGESNAIGVVTLTPTATPGVSIASIPNLTRNVALPNGWRFVAATITNPNFAGANDFGYDHFVSRDNQTVEVTAPASVDFAPAGSFNVSAVATAVFTELPSGQAVNLSAGPAGVCSGSGSSSGNPGSNVVVTIEGGGTCVITASVPQSANYNAVAPQTVNVQIDPIDQTITFAALPNRPATAGTFELVATAPAGAVSFASTTTDVCTVSGTTVSFVGAGVCSITASQAGNASYNAAPDVVQSFAYVEVVVGPETLVDGTRNAPYTAQFTASGIGAALPFTFAVTAGVLPDGLTLAANGELSGTPISAGTYNFTVTATDASDVPNLGTPYSGSRAYTLVIAKNPQVITFGAAPSLVYAGVDGTLSATGGASGNPVVFSSLTPTICSVTGDQVTPLLAGTCTVAADQAGDSDYEDAPQVTQDIEVAKAAQAALTAAATPSTVAYLQTSALSVTGGSTSGDVTYAVTAGETFCEISGSTLTAIAADGSCTVTATMAGDDNYLPVSGTVVVDTIKAMQADFAVAADPTTIQFNGTSALSTTGGNGSGAVSYAITAENVIDGVNVCALSGSTITGVGTGTCEVTATKAADANYEQATDSVVITVAKSDQTISFGANPGPLTIGGATGSVVATATSGLTVVYGVAAGSETVCDVDPVTGGITLLTAGDCVLTANQAGDDFYNAAAEVTQTVVIQKEQPSIGLVGSGSPTSPGNAVTFTATVSGGYAPTGSVTFQNDGADIAGCIGVALTGLTAECVTTDLPQGSHPVTAIYNGDINNLTATSNTVTQVVLTGTTITLNAGNLIEARFGQPVSVGYTVSGGVAPNDGDVTVTATRPGSTLTCTAAASAGACTLTGLVTTGPALPDGYVITASYAGDTDDGASSTVSSQTLNVLRSNTNTALVLTPATSSPFGQGFTLTATVTAVAPGAGVPPGTIVFLRDGESIGEVALNGAGVAVFNVAPGLPVGNYVFRAEYAQTTNYLQSFENRNYAITAKATTTTITGASANPSALSDSVQFSYTVTTTPADSTPTGNVTLTASTGETNTCTVAAGECALSFGTAGARTVTAAYAGDSQHASSTSAAFSQSVDQGSTTAALSITPASPAQIGQQVSFDVTITGTPGSPLPTGTVNVVHGTGTPICSFTLPATGCQFTFSTEQSLSDVRAVYAGDTNFTGATSNIVASYAVEKVSTSIVFVTADSTIAFGQSISIATSVSGGINGNLGLVSVTATAVGKDPVSCSAVASAGSCTLTGLDAAAWTLSASYAGDADDQASSTATGITVTVDKASQTITFGANPGPFTFGGTAGSVSAEASSGLPVSFSTASAACSVDAVTGAITIIGAGDCVVAANQAGNDNYEAAPEATQTVVIDKASQTITFGANPGPFTFGGAAGSVSATASSGLPVSFSTASTTVCSVDAVSGAITIIGAGNCVVAANQAGDDNYAAAPEVTQTVVIDKASQTITFGANPGPFTFGGAAGSVSATASSSLAVSYSTASTTVCSVDAVSGAITIIGAGNCVVAANQAGNDNYLAAPEVTQTVVINPGDQAALVVTATPNPVVAGQTSTLSTTGGSGTGAVTYAVTTGGASCTVTGNTLTAVAAGDCTVTATKAGDGNYQPVTGTVVVTVNPAPVDLSIVKTGRYTLSGVTWELLVSNAGPGGAVGASVVDALPSEVSGASWTCASNSGGGNCVTASGTGDVDVDVNLPANSSVVITITAAVVGTPAAISNTATVIAPDGITDTNPGNNTSVLNLTVALFSDGFEDNSLQTTAVLKSSIGVVEIDRTALEAMLDGYKSVNAAHYILGEQQLQLQVREVNGLLQVRLLQSEAKQSLSSTRWMDVWPGDAVRIAYAAINGELNTRLAVGAQ